VRIVIDTNDFISALIGRTHRAKLERILLNKDIQVLADLVLLQEIREVAYRDKFRKYVTIEEADQFIETLKMRLEPIQVTSIITVSRDPDDNFLLALAKDGKADYILSGDKPGLLSLHSFDNIPIIRLQEFLDILNKMIN
jgi:putative PIN family toxin of toxin-antitoxin system